MFDFILKAGPNRLYAALAIIAVVAALLFSTFVRMGGEPKALLFAGVEMREAAEITQRLEQADIAYEVRGDGSSIFVARSRVPEARMMLSAEGLPSRGSIGYEIFDQPDALGQTQFQQNINRLRALEGELARTIASLDGIASARVHLVLPERQLFARDAEQPSASIVLQLRRDALTPGQVRAIRNLVASATPGLTTNRVTIVDETGNLLASASNEAGAAAEAVDARQVAVEERIRRTVTDIVEGVVGSGNARVQVTAEMDFNRVEERRQTFDPEGRVVRSTSTSEGNSNSTQRTQGVTAGANVPDGNATAQAPGSQDSDATSQETVNYEISNTLRTEISEGGRLRRLSVAVAVDGVTTPGEGENAAPQYAPRSAEEMQRLTQLVRSAVGFNEQRGDVIEVVNAQFARTAAAAETAAKPGMFDFLGNLDVMRIIELAAMLIASLAFVFFVLRPLITGLVRGGAAGPPAVTGPAGAGAVALPGGGGAAALLAPDDDIIEPSIDIAQIQGRVRASSVKKVAEVVNQHPDESVQIIRGWLNNAL